MKRHLLFFSALFAGVAGSALAGGYGAAPYGAVQQTGAVVHAPAPQGQPIYVNGRSVYDDRGAGASSGVVWGGAQAGAAYYGAPIVEQQVVSQDVQVQQVGAAAHAWPLHEAPGRVGHVVGGPGPIIQQTTTQQDLVAVTSVQPTLVQARGGWGPRVFVGASAGVAFGAGLQSGSETLSIDKGYGLGVHAGVKFGGGWRAKVEYMRLAGRIEFEGGGNGGGGHGGGCVQKPDCGGGKGGGWKSVSKPGNGGEGGGGNGGGVYDYTANAGFVTVEKAFEVSKTIQPYVGFGVGYVNPSLQSVSGLKGSAAVKASVGASVALSDQLEAYGEYAYVLAPGMEFDGGEDGPLKIDYDTHLLSAGVRVTFN